MSSIDSSSEAPSSKAGLKEGDIITSFNGNQVTTWRELVGYIEENPNSNVSIGYTRNGQSYVTTAVLESRVIANNESGYLGVSPTIENQKMGIIDSIAATTLVAVSYTHLRAHETSLHLVCRLLLEKKKQ